jgi:hypothetical protein
MAKESKNKLTVKDRALGGKMRCPGCGGEWWVSGPQAKHAEKHGWPTKCGNSKGVVAAGTREDCEYEGEMEFVPYDVQENLRIFKERGDKAAETLEEMVVKMVDKEKGGNR